jgi:hypothetical protein
LVTVHHPEHPAAKPEYAAHAGGGQTGPEENAPRVVRRDVRAENEEHENEERGDQDCVDYEIEGLDVLGFGLSHGGKESDNDAFVQWKVAAAGGREDDVG